MKIRGIAFKLTLLILSGVTMIFLGIFGYNYIYSRKIITENIEKNAINLARATVNQIDMVLTSVEKVPENLSYVLEGSLCKGEELNNLLKYAVQKNDEIYGATVAFEPWAYDGKKERYAPYFYKGKGGISYADLGNASYPYFFQDWYQIPKELNRAVWSEPYFDETGGSIIMSTYSVPFYKMVNGEKKMAGIITSDVSLSWLQEIVASIKIADTGFGFLISQNGTVVTHPDKNFIMNETIFSQAELRGYDEMRSIGRDMIRGKSGFVPFRSFITGKMCWMVYAPLSSTNWSLGVLFPQDELMADVMRLNQTVITLGSIGFVFLFIVIVLIARSIARPLVLLAGAAEDIAEGNLNVSIPEIGTGDEVGKLARSFDYMKHSLKQYIADLTQTTAAKERIESELNIAHDIQMGILPKIYPPFPEMTEFNLYAAIKPAREVGGDLFDFFFLDDDHLCFNVGDVSGKGVPASLFMAITKTLIKTVATKDMSPELILDRVNQDLSMDNPSLLFVTLFLGIINIKNGTIIFCNGGHNPPYIIRASGEIKAVETTSGLALGVMEDFKFQSKTERLDRGDAIFIYSDGVTEAMNSNQELFSEHRLEIELKRLKKLTVKGIIDGVMEKISEFSQNEPQADDITMMIIRYNGSDESCDIYTT